MSNDAPLLEVEGVSARFALRLRSSLRYGLIDTARDLIGLGPRVHNGRDEFWAVDDVSFIVRRGECVGLLGANGAGKSTMLKITAGLLKPDRGSVTVRGRVGALIELGAGMHPLLSGRENIRVNAAILGLTQREIDQKMEQIIDFADLGEFIDAPVRGYSSGMRVRLGFAVAAHLEPDLLLVDEVLAVGDSAFRMKCFQRILDLKERGTSIVLVTHQMPDLARVGDRAIVLDKGRKVADDSLPIAIATYEQLLLRRDSIDQRRNAAAPLHVKAVHVLDGQGAPTRTLRTGGEMSVVVNVECTSPVHGGRARIYVESPHSGVLAGFSTAARGEAMDFDPPSARLRLRIPEIPFKVGGYSIGVGLFGPGPTGLMFNQPGLATFSVTEPPVQPFGYDNDGLVDIKHAWVRE